MTYQNDPRWITTRRAGACAKCGAPHRKGASVFWYPLTKTGLGEACGCGREAAGAFAAEAFDEEMLR